MANHMEVAHRWAQDKQDGKSLRGYAMYYEGDTIYSWGNHFPIAKFVTDNNGNRVILFNNATYSVSTSKHQTYTRRAIRRDDKVFTVKYMEVGEWSNAENAKDLLARAVASLAASKRRRSPSMAAHDIATAGGLLREAKAFADAFGVKGLVIPTFLDDIESLAEQANEKAKTEQAEKAKREKERRAAERERDANKFAMWLSGESHYCPHTYRTDAKGFAYIRREGDSLQTSQGASVPWEHAIKAFRFIKLCRETGQAFKTNGRVIRVGHYQVDWIDTDGNFKAGCHMFAWPEIERLALREGVFDQAPSADVVEVREHA